MTISAAGPATGALVKLRAAEGRAPRDPNGMRIPHDLDLPVTWSTFWSRLADAGDVIVAVASKPKTKEQ